MEHKNVVGKSKSTNIGTATDQTQLKTANKKTWSSARFAYINSKKRGVYVEKKPKIPAGAEHSIARLGLSDVPNVEKSTRRQRRNDKSFLTRCLNILSQDTIATQFPDVKTSKPTANDNLSAAVTVDKSSQDMDAIFSENSPSPQYNKSPRTRRSPKQRQPEAPAQIKQRKPKFRSKALSDNFKDLHVNKPRKSLSHSLDPKSRFLNANRIATKSSAERKLKRTALEPNALPAEDTAKENLEKDDEISVHTTESKKSKKSKVEYKRPLYAAINPDHDDLTPSESKKLKTILRFDDNKDLPQTITSASERDDVKTPARNDSNIIRTKKVSRKVSVEEPSTLVSDYNNKNKSLYNLFVDLLETTFSVYNVESKYTNNLKTTVEIEQKVDPKINTSMSQNKTVYFKTAAPSRTYEPQRVLFNEIDDVVTEKVRVYNVGLRRKSYLPPAVPKSSPFRRNEYETNFQRAYRNDYRPTKSRSFWNAQRRINSTASKSNRSVRPKKDPPLKKHKGQDLLEILKQELQMDADYYDEPGDFHEALARIAKEKKQTRKLIHFDDDDGADGSGKSECFKRRKVLSGSTKSPKKRANVMRLEYSMPVYNEGFGRSMYQPSNEDEPSYHSIVVKGYDYERRQYLGNIDLANKSLIYTSNSQISLRSEYISTNDLLEDKNAKLSRVSLSKTASTTISQLLHKEY